MRRFAAYLNFWLTLHKFVRNDTDGSTTQNTWHYLEVIMYKYICSFCISWRLTVNFFPETFLFPISSFVFASVATARVWYLWNKQQKFSVHMWYWPSSMGWILAEFFCQSWAGKMDPSSCLGLANQNERFTLYHPWVLPAIVFVINEAAVVLFPDTFLESIQTADGSQSDTTLIFEIN